MKRWGVRFRGLGTLLIAGLAACVTVPGMWSALKTLEGTFAVSSPPEPAVVATNGLGHTLAVWDAIGIPRYAEHTKGGAWSLSRPVVIGAIGQFATAAIGDDETAAVAWVTVATEFTPAYVVASVRDPGGSFLAPTQVALGTSVYYLKLGIAGDGSVTLVWAAPAGILASTRAPLGTWSTPIQLSASGVGAGLPDLTVNGAGAVLAVWQQGSAGNPSAIGTAYRSAGGGWEAPRVLPSGSGLATWNPKPGLDAAGNAAVGYLDGYAMVVTSRKPTSDWDVPAQVSPAAQTVYYPALAMDGAGDVIAAWQALDAGNVGTVYVRPRPAGGDWGTTTRLSAASDDAQWPTAAYAGDGSLAVVSWIDNWTSQVRASVGTVTASWSRTTLGAGWWGSHVPVAAGGGSAVATWATVVGGNPNAASLVAKTFE